MRHLLNETSAVRQQSVFMFLMALGMNKYQFRNQIYSWNLYGTGRMIKFGF